MKAAVRTIMGDDPNTITQDTEVAIREDVTSATCIEVPGLGWAFYSAVQDRGMFTQGPGHERDADVVHADNGDIELTILKNGRGQRRIVVVLSASS